jgi:methylmalonyl-CoA mutase cobalamin-binding subunit
MKIIIGAAIGSCVHVGGLHRFLEIAEEEGYKTTSMGAAVSLEQLVKAINDIKPDIVAVSYRLTPEAAASLFSELRSRVSESGIKDLRFVFGGTPPVAKLARESGLFERAFDGTEPAGAVKEYLRGEDLKQGKESFPETLTERIAKSYPYPIIRHHFGRPSLSDTIAGTKLIAEAGVLDVLSIGPDQNAQEHFFNPGKMDRKQDGAGGVPLRQAEDLEAIYQATRRGNFPLVRCYAGTRDMMKWAEMSVRTINNAWAAIPLCWYSVLDGRSERQLDEAMKEHLEVMHWYAEKGIPVEVNESHQWSLRNAHDSLAVTMAFLAAIYVQQPARHQS